MAEVWTPKEIAWAAGLFEGEGSMSIRANRGVTLFLGSTDRDVVEQFALIVGAGRIHIKRRPRAEWKDIHAWHCDRAEDVRRILNAFLPWFGERRKQRAVEMLERLAKNPGARAAWMVCPHGHPLSGENLYVNEKSGKRMCRACHARRQREWQAKRGERS